MSIFNCDTSSSSTSTTFNDYYGNTRRAEMRAEMRGEIGRSYADRPLAHLAEKEHLIKEQSDEPSGGMPKELILFDPKELVLGGKK